MAKYFDVHYWVARWMDWDFKRKHKTQPPTP